MNQSKAILATDDGDRRSAARSTETVRPHPPIQSRGAIMVDLRVSELLCSRLCHDLVSPIGAINNGIELIEELGDDMVGEAMGLIQQSGHRAGSVLALYRLAYGAAGASAAGRLEEARGISERYLSYGKSTLNWRIEKEAGSTFPTGTVKLILNLVVLAEEALTYGGTITVDLDQGQQPPCVTVTSIGDRAGLDESALRALSNQVPTSTLTPRTVHPYITGLFARDYGLPLSVNALRDGAVKFTLELRGSPTP